MKKFNIKTLMILVMVLLLSVNTVFANGSEEPNTKATGMAIGDRINVPDINIITSGDVTFQDEDGNVVANPTPDSKLRVQFDWAFEMGKGYDWNLVQAGDFYQFQLPKDFVVPQVFTGSLSEYGDFHIAKDGLVTLTFNDNVNSNSIIKGKVEFDVSLNATEMGDLGRKEIELPFADNKVLEFTLQPNTKQDQIEKQGKVDTTHNTKSIVWDVNINKSYETLTGVVVTDDIPKSVVLEKVEVFPLHLNADGSYKYHGEALSPDLYTVGDGNSISFKDTIHEAYTIRYHTKVKEEEKLPNGGTVTIVNKASMVSDTTSSIGTSASVDAEYGQLIKKSKRDYFPEQQIVEWEVRYNFGAKEILNGELVDVFSSNLEYIDGSIEIKNIKNQTVNLKTTVTPQAGGLNIKFDDVVNQELIITYKTKVKDGVVIKGG